MKLFARIFKIEYIIESIEQLSLPEPEEKSLFIEKACRKIQAVDKNRSTGG